MKAALAADETLSAIARGGSLNFAGSLIAGVSTFAVTIAVTNGWDAETAGVLFSVTSIFLIMVAISLLGADTALARYVLGFEAQSRQAHAEFVLRIARNAVLVAAVVLGCAMLVLAPVLVDLLGFPESSTTVLRLLGVAMPLAVISEFSLAATRAYGIMRITVIVDRVVRSGVQILTVALAAWLGVGLIGLSLAWVAPYALAAALAPLALARLVRSRRESPPELSSLPPGSRAGVKRDFWRFAWPRAVARICQVGLQRADILLVAALRSPAEAALYTAATRFVVIGQVGVQAVQQVLQPRLARLLAAGDAEALRTVFSTSTAWIIGLAWPVYLTTAITAPLYLSVFGRQYADTGQFVVVIVAMGMLLATGAGPVDVLLLMSGRSGLSLMNNVASLIVNLGANVVLIPRMGADGAAISWAIALAVRNLLPFWQVRSILGASGIGRAAIMTALASIGCFVVPMATLRLFLGLTHPSVAAVLALEVLVYGVLLWRWRDLLQLAAIRPRSSDRLTA